MKQRVAIHARSSSARHADQSIDDQVHLFRERPARGGWAITGVFTDVAPSGEIHGRPGLASLLGDLPDTDIVLVESPDRLSRDRAEIGALLERLEVEECTLVTVAGEAVGGIPAR